MKTRKLLIAGAILLGFFVSSCHNDPDLSAVPEISFTNNIQPIMAGNCTVSGCHNSTDGRKFPLETYEQVIAGGVTPGEPWNSDLYRCIANRTFELMPPDGPMADQDIQMVYLWIIQGAKNN